MLYIILILLLILYTSYRLYEYFNPSPNVNSDGKYVLISGCDTGFGRGLAIELDNHGFNVFATVYKGENQDPLRNELSSRATVFCLDITEPTQIDAAYTIVLGKTNVLHALVNNAGIDQDGLIDWITLDFMRNMMDINFYGHVNMTKKFLPLLIAKRDSRVVNICSVAGFLAAPGMAAYSASKFALESFSDCLRREMHSWGLHVSIIEPGYMRTPIIEGQVEIMRNNFNRLPNDVRDRWGEDYLNNIANKRLNNIFIHFAENPITVVHALQHAVSNTKPLIRYRPGWQSKFIFFPLSMLPAWLTDLILNKGRGRNVIPAGVSQQLRS